MPVRHTNQQRRARPLHFVQMITRRAKKQDMFGRPVQAPSRGSTPNGASQQRSDEPRQRSSPPGLLPWIPVLFLVAVLAVIIAAPAFVSIPVVIVAVLTVCGRIAVTLYKANRDVPYYELRRRDPLYRSFDYFRRGRGYRGLDQDGPAE